ncbi:MAG: hypothetical protein NTZ55_05285 [Candidatus Roizmanbacteria bacterium]|nr:hypothetical protein [Candidatus Roizmanbacteria bacterium]
MKDISDLLTELAKESTHIISNPETIAQLQKQGVKFDESKKLTIEEVVQNLFLQRKNVALKNIVKFTPPPNIAIPPIGLLYDEIRECILFELYGAAISLSAILVEFSLKNAIIKKKYGDKYNQEEWDKLENMELGPTIQEGIKIGIVDAKMEKGLKSFKNTIRNPYLHYNIKKITENVEARKVKRMDIKTREVIEVNLDAKDNPIVWALAKKFVDRELVFQVFEFADTLVRNLFVKPIDND